MLEAGQCQVASTTFRLYVTPAKNGSFAEALSAAVSNEEVDGVLADIKSRLDKKKNPPACAAKFLRYSMLPRTFAMALSGILNSMRAQTIHWKASGTFFGRRLLKPTLTDCALRYRPS